MYQRIVDRDQLAISVSGSFDASFDPTLFIVSAQPKDGVSPAAVEKVINEELERVRSGLVSDSEMEKAKNILLAGFYRQMKTINGKANTLGTYEVFFGDYRKLFSAAEEYRRVTKEDLQRVAKQYLQSRNSTVATLVPESGQGK